MTTEIIQQKRDAWREHMLARKDSYTSQAKVFVRFLDGELDGVKRDITLTALQDYATWMRDQKTRLGTFNLRLSAAKARIRMLFDMSPEGMDIAKRHRFEESLRTVKPLRRQSRRVDGGAIPTWEEVQRVITETRSARTRLFIGFLLTTGCRVSEMIGAQWNRAQILDGEHYEVEVLGKGAKLRKVWVKADLMERVRTEFGGARYLFETTQGNQFGRTHVSDEIARAFRRVLGAGRKRGQLASRPRVSAHKLRHVFATTAMKRGWSANSLRDYLGHADISTTLQMYVHDAASWQDVKRIIE